MAALPHVHAALDAHRGDPIVAAQGLLLLLELSSKATNKARTRTRRVRPLRVAFLFELEYTAPTWRRRPCPWHSVQSSATLVPAHQYRRELGCLHGSWESLGTIVTYCLVLCAFLAWQVNLMAEVGLVRALLTTHEGVVAVVENGLAFLAFLAEDAANKVASG
jgi:hypothetical protein